MERQGLTRESRKVLPIKSIGNEQTRGIYRTKFLKNDSFSHEFRKISRRPQKICLIAAKAKNLDKLAFEQWFRGENYSRIRLDS